MIEPATSDCPGVLMPIGGAEDKKAQRAVLGRFVTEAGAEKARIAVLPAASEFAFATGDRYARLFKAMGAEHVESLHIADRRTANDPDIARRLALTTGIFLTGGDQLRLLSLIGGTAVADALRAAHARGAAIAGTSAGASAMSLHMIAFGRSGATPSQRMVQLAPGLGLAHSLIIDQHFSQRDRLGRLTTAVALSPGMIGLGVDEDTTALIRCDGHTEVLGSGTVTVVDGRDLEHSNIYAVKGYRPVTVNGIQVSVYHAGEHFHLPLEVRDAHSQLNRVAS